MNSTLDEIWQEFAVVAQLPPFPLMKCLTLKLPEKTKSMDLTLNIRNDAGLAIMFWDFKDPGMSKIVHSPDWKNAKYTTFPTNGEYNAFDMKSYRLMDISP